MVNLQYDVDDDLDCMLLFHRQRIWTTFYPLMLYCLPSATSHAFFSWEWCAFFISLSLKIFSSALVRNISLGLLPLRIMLNRHHIKWKTCIILVDEQMLRWNGTPVTVIHHWYHVTKCRRYDLVPFSLQCREKAYQINDTSVPVPLQTGSLFILKSIAMDSKNALKTWEMSNSIENVNSIDEIYRYDKRQQQDILTAKPWDKEYLFYPRIYL